MSPDVDGGPTQSIKGPQYNHFHVLGHKRGQGMLHTLPGSWSKAHVRESYNDVAQLPR